MTALGMYLFISLFFVVGGMVEFAVLVFMLRRSENKSLKACIFENHLTGNDNTDHLLEYTEDRMSLKSSFKSRSASQYNQKAKTAKVTTFKMSFHDYSYTIDFAAMIIFPITYIFFNIIYWLYYLH